MAVVGDDRRVGNQRSTGARNRLAGSYEPRVVLREAREHGQEPNCEQSGGGNRNESSRSRVPVEGGGCQQRERGQGGVEVAVAAGIGPDRYQTEHGRAVGEGGGGRAGGGGGGGRKAERREPHPRDGRHAPWGGGPAPPQGGSRGPRLKRGKARHGRDPDPGLGGGHAGEHRQQSGNLHPAA